jgi:hypothetical protein
MVSCFLHTRTMAGSSEPEVETEMGGPFVVLSLSALSSSVCVDRRQTIDLHENSRKSAVIFRFSENLEIDKSGSNKDLDDLRKIGGRSDRSNQKMR